MGLDDQVLTLRNSGVCGRAFWSAGRREASCGLRNVSTVGALVEQPDVLLTLGQQLALRIDLGGGEMPAVVGTVVRANHGGVAIRFERLTQAFLKALASAASEKPDPS